MLKSKCPEYSSVPLLLVKQYACRHDEYLQAGFSLGSNTCVSPRRRSDFLSAPRPVLFPPQGALSLWFLNLILPLLLYMPPSLLPILCLISPLVCWNTHTHTHTSPISSLGHGWRLSVLRWKDIILTFAHCLLLPWWCCVKLIANNNTTCLIKYEHQTYNHLLMEGKN